MLRMLYFFSIIFMTKTGWLSSASINVISGIHDIRQIFIAKLADNR
ncbi:hypothetical protein D1AOALGA4SA_662 [Olavius algarvensis Delta 1 endosymbiont]|nr:hypothetical protein D1AOALGA4SA_662 [Olavius algarvensis Delta 1 endosymbiont]